MTSGTINSLTGFYGLVGQGVNFGGTVNFQWTGPVLPSLPLITFPQKKTLRWSATKQDALSGKRVRYSLFTYPIYAYELPISGLRTAAALLEYQTLAGFINSLAGTVGLFGYTDPQDNSVTLQEFGVGDGATTTFRLVRSLGGFTEPVFLLNGLSTYYVGSVQTFPLSVSPYGVVTFASPPPQGAPLQWTGSYYWPCRFDDDASDFNQFVYGIYEMKALKFSTEKLP